MDDGFLALGILFLSALFFSFFQLLPGSQHVNCTYIKYDRNYPMAEDPQNLRVCVVCCDCLPELLVPELPDMAFSDRYIRLVIAHTDAVGGHGFGLIKDCARLGCSCKVRTKAVMVWREGPVIRPQNLTYTKNATALGERVQGRG